MEKNNFRLFFIIENFFNFLKKIHEILGKIWAKI